MDPNTLEISKAAADGGAHEFVAQIFRWIRNPDNPKHILKTAETESEARLVKLETTCGFTREEAQAINRTILLQNLYDVNYSKIIGKATSLIDPMASIQNMSTDWLLSHYEQASKHSDEEIQNLWAKILAGELNCSGSFSRRTLNLVGQLDKEDARLFNNLGTCFFTCDGKTELVIFDLNEDFIKIVGLSWVEIIRLESLGLITIAPRVGITGKLVNLFSKQQQIQCSYFDCNGVLKQSEGCDQNGDFSFPLGIVSLTREGEELSSICAPEPNNQFLEYTRQIWEKYNCEFIG